MMDLTVSSLMGRACVSSLMDLTVSSLMDRTCMCFVVFVVTS
jgi:hypothetical protein